MDKVPWVGNGWVQLTHVQLWVGYGYSCQAQCRTLLYTLPCIQQMGPANDSIKQYVASNNLGEVS
jgi:hypothetical protein